jgi:hypothetical protein
MYLYYKIRTYNVFSKTKTPKNMQQMRDPDPNNNREVQAVPASYRTPALLLL